MTGENEQIIHPFSLTVVTIIDMSSEYQLTDNATQGPHLDRVPATQ